MTISGLPAIVGARSSALTRRLVKKTFKFVCSEVVTIHFRLLFLHKVVKVGQAGTEMKGEGTVNWIQTLSKLSGQYAWHFLLA